MTTLTQEDQTHCLDAFDAIDSVFAIRGDDMRTHRGRSVVAIPINGERHFLKRFWFDPAQPFKRNVARGLHELRMIDWLHNNGFIGPVVIRRGQGSIGPICTRMFFLMSEVRGEQPLETAWRLDQQHADSLLLAVGDFAARLHDAGFCHTDFSERHIFVGGSPGAWTFRLIDVERASINRATERNNASDLATLAASVMDERLRSAIRTTVIDRYLTARKTLAGSINFRSLLTNAKPTKSF